MSPPDPANPKSSATPWYHHVGKFVGYLIVVILAIISFIYIFNLVSRVVDKDNSISVTDAEDNSISVTDAEDYGSGSGWWW